MSTFAERLRTLRLSEGLTQQRLADRLSIKRSALAMYECGKRFPRFSAVERIADYFSVSIDFLLRGDRNVRTD